MLKDRRNLLCTCRMVNFEYLDSIASLSMQEDCAPDKLFEHDVLYVVSHLLSLAQAKWNLYKTRGIPKADCERSTDKIRVDKDYQQLAFGRARGGVQYATKNIIQRMECKASSYV